MNTPIKLNRWIVWPAVAVLVAVVLVACGGGGSETASPTEMRLASSSAAKAMTSVTWSPESISQTIKPGETKSATITLTAMKSTPSALLRVVPEIAPYVSVTPTSIGPLTAGQSVQVTLAFAAKVDALPLAATGTVQLRTADASDNTLAQPLPVSLNVIWDSTTTPDGITIQYPPSFAAIYDTVFRQLIIQPKVGSGTDTPVDLPGIFISIDQNPSNIPFEQYYSDGGPGLDLIGDSFGNYSTTSANGKSSYRLKPASGLSAQVYVVVPLPGRFVVIYDSGAAFQKSGVFDQIVNSLVTGA